MTKSDAPKKSQATKLVELAKQVQLFHDVDNVGYVTIDQGNHLETYRIRTKPFKHWLSKLYFAKYDSTPSSQSIQDAIGTLEGQAMFNAPQRDVNTRIAGDDSRLVIDLGTSNWERVVVTRDGWQIANDNNELFIRSRGLQPLPIPKRTTNGLQIFRRFVNVAEEELPLLVGWLIGALRPVGPYPLLAIHGEQGSAKSTTSRVCRRLIDPNKADLRSGPRDERDLIIAASNSWVIALENLSSIPTWLSDSLCRIATGAGYATRELYTDLDEIIFNLQRPVLINGIEELASRSDLIDRSIMLSLPRISEKKRITESEFWSEFCEAQNSIFGWLLDCVATAFKNLSSVELESLPRMADFAKWVCASESSIGWDGPRFITSYLGNREDANVTAIEGSAIGQPVLDYLEEHGCFNGTASDLLDLLDDLASEQVRKQRQSKSSNWPKTPRGLSGQLRRIAPNLRQLRCDVEFDLPNRNLRLAKQTTEPTVGSELDASFCNSLQDGSNGFDGQLHNQSDNVRCDCGHRMVSEKIVVDGWRKWRCASCFKTKPVKAMGY